MNVKLHRLEDLQRLSEISRKELNTKQRDRYRAVLLALENQTTEAIMRILDHSRNFVQRWVYAYRDGGIDAICPRRPTGRLRKLTELEEVERIREEKTRQNNRDMAPG